MLGFRIQDILDKLKLFLHTFVQKINSVIFINLKMTSAAKFVDTRKYVHQVHRCIPLWSSFLVLVLVWL